MNLKPHEIKPLMEPLAQGAARLSLADRARHGAEWLTMNKNLDPSTHRIFQALGLMLGLFAGRRVMDVLVGEMPGGEKIDKQDLPWCFRWAHGLMSYNRYADDDHNREMKIIDQAIPVAGGMMGGMAGSYHFATGQKPYELAKAGEKNLANLLPEQAESMAKLALSAPWRWVAAVASSGGSSMGHAFFPGNFSYGGALGSSFLFYVDRDKTSGAMPGMQTVSRYMTGNKHYYSYGPATMIGKLREQMLHNPAEKPAEVEKMAYSLLEQWHGDKVTDGHVAQFLDIVYAARKPFWREGGIPAEAKAEAAKALDAVIAGAGLEKTELKIGLNPLERAVGRYGFLERFSRFCGQEGALNKIQDSYRRAAAKRLNLSYEPAHYVQLRAKTHPKDAALFAAGSLMYAGLLGGMGLWVADSFQKKQKEIADAKRGKADAPNVESASETPIAEVSAVSVDGGRQAKADTLYSKALKSIDWVLEGTNSQDTMGSHRAWCGIMMGGYGLVALKMMEALTGRTLSGAAVPKEKVPEFLHGIYKKLPYNPFSDRAADRWMQCVHGTTLSTAAAFGILTASSHYFRERRRAIERADYTIDNVTEKVMQETSAPWGLLTATSGAFLATPSMNILAAIPGINYGASLGTLFMTRAGREVSMPGIGKWWSGNESLYPEAAPKLLDRMVKYALHNPDRHPEQLEAMAIGILKPWFKKVTPEQVHQFVAKVEADRDQFLAAGGIPEQRRKECEALLLKHFEGRGLENTLRELGLDPLEADVDSNGVSGRVARMMGVGPKIDKIVEDYHAKYTERLRREEALKVTAEPQMDLGA